MDWSGGWRGRKEGIYVNWLAVWKLYKFEHGDFASSSTELKSDVAVTCVQKRRLCNSRIALAFSGGDFFVDGLAIAWLSHSDSLPSEFLENRWFFILIFFFWRLDGSADEFGDGEESEDEEAEAGGWGFFGRPSRSISQAIQIPLLFGGIALIFSLSLCDLIEIDFGVRSVWGTNRRIRKNSSRNVGEFQQIEPSNSCFQYCTSVINHRFVL